MPKGFDIKAQQGYHMVLANLKDRKILGRYTFDQIDQARKDRIDYLNKYPMYHVRDVVLWNDTWGWVESQWYV